MSASAANDTVTAAAGGGGSSSHITKHNINSFDYFQLFGLTLPVDGVGAVDIDIAAVRRVYRRLSLRFHPDKDDSDEARYAFGVVHTALETVMDPVKRAAYIQERRAEAEGVGGSSKGCADEDARQRQRTQQAQEEAQWAAEVLNQREQQRRAKEAAALQAAQEREEAAQRVLSELTSTLNTPFQQMEAELVRDWDVDEEMVEMKMNDVINLLRLLAPAEKSVDAAEVYGGPSRKRDRESAEAP
jgi:curved DNA-binding protein CbpA